jgi:hypothetical protein
MVVHLAMSIALGMALAVLVTTIGGWATTPADAALAGMAFGLIVWLVMQYLLWDAINPAAAERFPLGVRHRPPDVRAGHRPGHRRRPQQRGHGPNRPLTPPRRREDSSARADPRLRCPGGLVDHARQLGHRGKR